MMGLISLLVLALSHPPQEQTPGSQIRSAPLSADHIAVYREVLDTLARERKGALNLANVTAPLRDPIGPGSSCARALELEDAGEALAGGRKLDPSVELHPRYVLVDPMRQTEQIDRNDPQKLILEALYGGAEVDEDEIRRSVENAFQVGLFTLSEIVFDKKHEHAIVAYSFRCGRLCGHGATWILERDDDGWRVADVCGQWIS